MSQVFNYIFDQYSSYPTYLIVLELIGVFFGIISVIFSKKNSVLVFPTGIISTLIFAYLLLFEWYLLGDAIINIYYFIMSVYGWYIWTKKINNTAVTPISTTTKNEKKTMAFIFIASVVFIVFIYQLFDKWIDWTAYVDTLTTGIFFVGMWLMARRKVENWIYWIVGDLISIPLYYYKGLVFTSLQYLLFSILAILGYLAWKKQVNRPVTR